MTAFAGDGVAFVARKPFATAFARPSRLRFEFRTAFAPFDEPWRRYIVWTDGVRVLTWWDVKPGVADSPSLELALAGATGVSGGSAQTVPTMLLPGRVWGRPPTEMSNPRRLDDEALGAAACFRIQGERRGTNDPERQERARRESMRISGRDPGITTRGPRTLWIDKASFALRRIDEATASTSGLRTESSTTYEPRLDLAIDEGGLAFNPPAQR